jgi:DMSO/TMAO reductase YedYZ molybdopterin-dependent catalytic subunit
MTMQKRFWLTAAATGALLTAPLIAVFFLAFRLAGVPFVTFDLFDWISRVLPGNIITAGIDAIVGLIGGLNLGPTSAAAKTIEQLMALALFLVVGIAATVVFYAVLRARHIKRNGLPGVIFGLVVAVPLLFISASVGLPEDAAPIFAIAWVLVAFGVWGYAAEWIYDRLAKIDAPESAPAATSSEAPAGTPARDTAVEATMINRRQFLVAVGGSAAVITVFGAGLGALLSDRQRTAIAVASANGGGQELPPGLPNADATVQPAPGTRLEYTPVSEHYRIDINLVSPTVEEANWTLPIHGMVDNPLNLTLDDIRNNYDSMDQYITLACISNPIGGDLIGTTKWTGVNLQRILEDAGVQDGAQYLLIKSADGFHETVALDFVRSDERVMLAYAWDDQPLTVDHGFPLRIYLPDRYGMKQPKWITDIEVSSEYEDGYWVRRGWDAVARMQTTSVVDSVATDALIDNNGNYLVPVGGIAHAGARGISKVEVKVDEGEWQEAQLRQPLSETTWVIWRFDWPFEEGRHTFAVRAYDGEGVMQDETRRGARPSGATGIMSRTATLEAPVQAG